MIPDNIRRADILAVIRQLDAGQIIVPPTQRSTGYCLVHNGTHYPPKFLIRAANRTVNGDELWGFHGGRETNNYLTDLRFRIIPHGGAPHT